MSGIKKFLRMKKYDILFFSVPLFSLIMIEYASRGSVANIIGWLIKEPVPFFTSLILFYSVYIFIWANLNHRGAAALTFSIIWFIISFIVGNKREILGTTLAPWDITVGANAAQIVSNTNLLQLHFLLDWIFLLIILVNIAIIIAVFIYQKEKYLKVKTVNILTAAAFAAVIVISLTLPKVEMADTSTVFNKEGYVRGFITNVKLWSSLNNSISATASSEEGNYQYDFKAKAAVEEIKPNIVFIMSEAFWDVTQLPNVTFSEDPIPNFHALKKEGISGEMVSNTYGGLTDNVEFEVMTGFSLRYLPYQTNAYTTTIKKSIPSLPAYLKNNGYQTVSVHPYDKSFFNRNKVYPLIGIDRFVTMADMPDAEYKGEYISDDTFADYIISEYERGGKPIFMYNISVQNHWPYTTANYYKDYGVKVNSNKKIDSESMIALKNYTQGLHDADQSLKRVVDYFRSVKDPTVIIFLGDHLPALTRELGVYKQLGYIDDSFCDADLFKGGEGANISDKNKFIQGQKIFKSPYLIWSNYEDGVSAQEGKTVSSNYLGVYSMSEVGLALPPFYNFLLDYSGKLPVNRYFLAIDSNGMPLTKVPANYDNYEKVYELVQNDMLFGDQRHKDLFDIK